MKRLSSTFRLGLAEVGGKTAALLELAVFAEGWHDQVTRSPSSLDVRSLGLEFLAELVGCGIGLSLGVEAQEGLELIDPVLGCDLEGELLT